MMRVARTAKTGRQERSALLFVVMFSLSILSTLSLSNPAQALTLDWTALNPAWDDTDTSGQQVFGNVDGSGIDVTVSYTDNMFDNDSVPNIYVAGVAPSPEIVDTLRFTNDRDGVLIPTSVTITFSEDVFITDVGTVSLSQIIFQQENMVVEAFDAAGAPVFATTYGTNTPGLVELDMDGDAAYRSRGLLRQEAGFYGDTFYSYTDSAVRELRFSIFTTAVGGDDIELGWSSQGITNVEFTAVPEPSVALLLGLGLLGLGVRRPASRT